MTVNTTQITSGPYVGNGVTTDFSYTFRVDIKTQLAVYRTDTGEDAVLLTVDSDYTVSGIGNDNGGVITMSVIPASNQTIFMRADYKYTQATDFDSQGGFFPDVHESAFDKNTFLTQQIKDVQDRRSLLFTDSEDRTAEQNIIPSAQTGYGLTWADDGTLINRLVSETVIIGNGEATDETAGINFDTLTDLINGVASGGRNINFSTIITETDKKIQVSTLVNNDTTSDGEGNYTLKTLAQAAIDGDVIDGTAGIGKNHATADGIHCVVLTGSKPFTAQLGGSTDTNVQLLVDQSSGTSNTISISGGATYNNNINWKGRRHSTDDLPHKILSFAKTNGQLGARMWVDGDVLYDCTYVTHNVNAYSLSDPREPSHIASYSVGVSPRHVTVSGRYMFVISNGDDKLQIFEIDSMVSAANIGEITVGAEPKMCIVKGNIIHVVCGLTSTLEKYSFIIEDGVATITLEASVGVITTPLAVAHNGAGILAVVGLSDGGVSIVGERNYNLIGTTDIGGGAKSTCEFISKTQLLIASPGDDRVYSVSIKTLSPVVTGFTDVVSDPEQLIIAGSRAYVPSLTTPPTLSTLSCIDIVDGNTPSEFKQIPLSVSGGGFGAYYDDGETGYIYVNGHFAPYNIDVIEVPIGKKLPVFNTDTFENIQAERGSIGTATIGTATLDTATIGTTTTSVLSATAMSGTVTWFKNAIRVVTTNNTLVITDNVIRIGNGADIALFDPSLASGLEVKILNVHASLASDVTNAFTGFSGTLSAGASVVLLSDGAQWDVVASHGTIT
jgi:hypothetical protein